MVAEISFPPFARALARCAPPFFPSRDHGVPWLSSQQFRDSPQLLCLPARNQMGKQRPHAFTFLPSHVRHSASPLYPQSVQCPLWVKSRHLQCTSRCPLSANSGLMQRSKRHRYSITSSARARSDGGIPRPSAFAVLRLITNSNLVG